MNSNRVQRMARPRGLRLSRKALDFMVAERRITRADACARAGISQQMLSDMAGVKRAGASMKTAAALADALDCPIELLFPEAAGFVVAAAEAVA